MSVGTDHDTAAFAVSTIRRWWAGMGAALYPKARRLLITADGGGSPSAGSGPKGKLNKSEHRLFSFIILIHQPELAWETAQQP